MTQRDESGRYPVLAFFAWGHLPEHLQAISRPFGELAYRMADELPPGPEVAAGLRKLLEAKDCAVRANLAAGKLEEARDVA